MYTPASQRQETQRPCEIMNIRRVLERTYIQSTDLYRINFDIEKLNYLTYPLQPIQKQNLVKWRQQMNPSQVLTFKKTESSTLRRYQHPITTKAQLLSFPSRAFFHSHHRAATRYLEWRNPH